MRKKAAVAQFPVREKHGEGGITCLANDQLLFQITIAKRVLLMSEIPAWLLKLLQCPNCHQDALLEEGSKLYCPGCLTRFPVSHHRPILFKPSNQLFEASNYLTPPKPECRRSLSKRIIPTPSVNLSVERMLPRLAELLKPSDRVLVVGAGRQRSWLTPLLGANRDIFYCDVDTSADVDFFCDAHDLPIRSASVDAVITTAVLEHVMYPERVAAEISRVVKVGGLLYSELPFMQQVHEGAYDFTRYTLSGHKRLFNDFASIESGLVAGPATTLVWSIEGFLTAFPKRPMTRNIVRAFSRLAFSWLKYFDYILKGRPQAMDGASCTFLLGRRSRQKVQDHSIIDEYHGGRPYTHS